MKKLVFILFVSIFCFSVYSQNEKTKKTNEIKEATVTYKRKTPEAKKSEQQKTVTTTPPDKKPVTNTPPAQTPKLDTIVKLGGKKLLCYVRKINPTSVQYVKPGSPVQLEILRKDIEKIIYSTGRKEIYNKPIFSMIDKTQWEAVMVTENEADVEDLYKVGVVKANASSGSRSPKAAKMSATIRLQKKTANLGALIVLVVSSEMKGGYGEIPGWELEGIAYSDTPPVDTAAVNEAIRKMIERRNKARAEANKKK